MAPDETNPVRVPKSDVPPRAGTRRLLIEFIVVSVFAVMPGVLSAIATLFPGGRAEFGSVRGEVFALLGDVRVTLALLYIMWLSGDSWRHFGLVQPDWLCDLGWGSALWIGSSLVTFAAWSVWQQLDLPGGGSGRLTFATVGLDDDWAQRYSYRGLILIGLLSGSFCEELVMRAYLIPRLERLLSSSRAAVIVSALLFGAWHLHQGPHGVIRTTVVGLIVGTAFVRVRRLWPMVCAHALHNLAIFFHIPPVGGFW